MVKKIISKDFQREFKFIIPAQEASIKLSYLIPTLSPYINKKKIESLCSDFNKISVKHKPSTALPLKVVLYQNGEIELFLKSLQVGYLIKSILGEILTYNSKLTCEDIYQIVWYKVRFLEMSKNKIKYSLSFLEKGIFSNILYGLRSSGLKINKQVTK